jgi:hypothetical protein
MLFFILFNSIVLCLLINSFLNVPDTANKSIQFSFIEGEKYLISEIHFNCHPDSYDLQCINLDRYKYDIKLNLDIIRKDEMVNSNIEVELKVTTVEKEFRIKKLIFMEKHSRLVESFYEMLLLPFNILGYYNEKAFEIDLMDSYDNGNIRLDSLQIILKDSKVNVKRGLVRFVPSVWMIWKLIASFRIISLPIIFVMSMFTQMVFWCIMWCLYRKINVEENGTSKFKFN